MATRWLLRTALSLAVMTSYSALSSGKVRASTTSAYGSSRSTQMAMVSGTLRKSTAVLILKMQVITQWILMVMVAATLWITTTMMMASWTTMTISHSILMSKPTPTTTVLVTMEMMMTTATVGPTPMRISVAAILWIQPAGRPTLMET